MLSIVTYTFNSQEVLAFMIMRGRSRKTETLWPFLAYRSTHHLILMRDVSLPLIRHKQLIPSLRWPAISLTKKGNTGRRNSGCISLFFRWRWMKWMKNVSFGCIRLVVLACEKKGREMGSYTVCCKWTWSHEKKKTFMAATEQK